MLRLKKGNDSIELPNSDRILNHDDIENSALSKMKDENDSRLTGEPLMLPKRIHNNKRKKRSDTKSPVLITAKVSTRRTPQRIQPNAPAPAFFLYESSISSQVSPVQTAQLLLAIRARCTILRLCTRRLSLNKVPKLQAKGGLNPPRKM